MRKRNIQKIVRFNRKEAQDLAAKAKKACLSEAGLIRLLIRGYEPKEKPDDRFYDVMRELSSIGNNINQLAAKANTLITVLSFILIMTVYGRFFKLYMYTALAPIPLSTFAGEPTQNVGKSFIKSYCAVLLEGAVIVLACIIFSVFASSPPVVNPDAAAVTQVWAYIGELVFNMLVLVGAVKMSDRIIREMMGL